MLNVQMFEMEKFLPAVHHDYIEVDLPWTELG